MKDTWIGFLGVVLTTLAAFAFVYGEKGGIREKLGRIDGILVGIEDRMKKVEERGDLTARDLKFLTGKLQSSRTPTLK